MDIFEDFLNYYLTICENPSPDGGLIDKTLAVIVDNKPLLIHQPLIVTDHSRMEFIYSSTDIHYLFGHKAIDFLSGNLELVVDSLHPDDRMRLRLLHADLFSFYFKLPPEERACFKYCFDHRFRRKDGSYFWLLHECLFLRMDIHNKPLITCNILTDISRFKRDENLYLYIFEMNKNPHEARRFCKSYPLLTRSQELTPREKEILKLIGEGLLSKQIADRLNLSLFTVNTHRQHMLAKTGTRTMNELISRAKEMNLI
jgi:DNA-binding CsgD family transcriptional regulator